MTYISKILGFQILNVHSFMANILRWRFSDLSISRLYHWYSELNVNLGLAYQHQMPKIELWFNIHETLPEYSYTSLTLMIWIAHPTPSRWLQNNYHAVNKDCDRHIEKVISQTRSVLCLLCSKRGQEVGYLWFLCSWCLLPAIMLCASIGLPKPNSCKSFLVCTTIH